jgi:peptidoglycan hydrolase-like protein with peptidoglycan-binding domain
MRNSDSGKTMHRSVYGFVALMLLTAAATPGFANTGPSGSSQLAVRQAQSELKREGLYDGTVDGIAGPKTRQGIIAFQRRERLPQTARLDDATRNRIVLNALRLDSAWSEGGQNVAGGDRDRNAARLRAGQ